MGLSRLASTAWVLVCVAACAAIGRASSIAYDRAGDSAYNGASTYDGINGGFGWGGPWSVGAANGGAFMGSGAAAINSPSDSSGRAWGLHPSPTREFVDNTNVVYRPFDGALAPGQAFRADLEFGSWQGDHTAGLGFLDSVTGLGSGPPGNGLVAYNDATWNPTLDYTVNFWSGGQSNVVHTGVPLTDRDIQIEFTVLDATNARLTISSLGGDTKSAAVVMPNYSFGYVAMYSDYAGVLPGPTADIYFNNIAVTPEPSGPMLVACTLATLLARRRRHIC